MNNYWSSIQTLLSQAKRQEEGIDLSGGPFLEEGEEYVRPYDELRLALNEAIKDIDFLKSHLHEWSEDSYCIHCGNDGRA